MHIRVAISLKHVALARMHATECASYYCTDTAQVYGVLLSTNMLHAMSADQ